MKRNKIILLSLLFSFIILYIIFFHSVVIGVIEWNKGIDAKNNRVEEFIIENNYKNIEELLLYFEETSNIVIIDVLNSDISFDFYNDLLWNLENTASIKIAESSLPIRFKTFFKLNTIFISVDNEAIPFIMFKDNLIYLNTDLCRIEESEFGMAYVYVGFIESIDADEFEDISYLWEEFLRLFDEGCVNDLKFSDMFKVEALQSILMPNPFYDPVQKKDMIDILYWNIVDNYLYLLVNFILSFIICYKVLFYIVERKK